ncbi:phosphopantetheine-binding protein [Streptomyces sp. NPDC127084]|uniref:phosphopantetheine-binding protein n=1 Tax=Streptomyces sp. NPDC127084 TaxID=3347133 RepID=UPI00364D9829
METADAVQHFIVTELLGDGEFNEIPHDYDLLDNGVIDSLHLLRLIDWLNRHFDVVIDSLEISPENFRSIEDIAGLISRSPSRSTPAGV